VNRATFMTRIGRRFNAWILFLELVCFAVVVLPHVALAQTGTLIAYGDAVTGSFSSAQPLTIYRFEGQANDRVTVTAIANNRARPRLILANSALAQLAISSNPAVASETESSAQIIFRLPQNALYYITIASADNTPGGFTLTLESDRVTVNPPPQAPTATPTPDSAPVIFNVQVSSFTTTAFSQTLPADAAHSLRLNFVDLAAAQPQAFRMLLTCDVNYEFMIEDLRCGAPVTFTPNPSDSVGVPVYGVNLALPQGSMVAALAYTLTVIPESPWVPVAPGDTDHLIDAALNSVTSFTQVISAPRGDTSDRLTVRVPDLLSGSRDFALSLLCSGTGVERVRWSPPNGQELACGDVTALTLAPGTNPIPTFDTVVSLSGEVLPAHAAYTLLIIPSGSGVAGSTSTYSFPVALTGPSEFLQALTGTITGHSVNVSVPGVSAGYPRTIAFTLACAGDALTEVKAGLSGVTAELRCGDAFQRTFFSAGDVAVFDIQRVSGGALTYMLYAQPVYAAVAPPDADPRALYLHPLDAVTHVDQVSMPEGDREDILIVDAAGVRTDQLPRAYTLSLDCEGTNSTSLRLDAGAGRTIACGGSLTHTFDAAGASGRDSGQTGAPAMPTLALDPRPTLAPSGDPSRLALRVFLLDSAGPGLVTYVLRAAPEGSVGEAPQVFNDYTINASSTTVTTFTQTLTASQQDYLRVHFPDLVNAHRQAFDLVLECSGVGTGAVAAYTSVGDTFGCGDSVYGEFDSGSSGAAPGIDVIVAFGSTDGQVGVTYTLRIEPASPYAPIAPDDSASEPYQLAIATTALTVFSQQISAPQGDMVDRIAGMIPDMIGGQSAGRDFTFWLECAGANASFGRFSVELPGAVPYVGLCGVPLVLFIDESAGSPPRPFIRIETAPTNQPVSLNYTLYIVPAGVESPPVIPVTPTLTPVIDVVTSTPPPLVPLPGGFQLISPANGAVFDTQPVLLTWTALPGGPRYNVEITRCHPQTGACSTDLVTATASEYLLTLAESAQVTWRVQVQLADGGVSQFTASRTFSVFLSTTPTPVPVTLELISPANGAVFDSQPVLLTWTTLPGGPRYNVEITRCHPQTGACSTELVTANASEYLLNLSASAQVTWRVQAINPDGSLSAFTPTRTFLVLLPTTPTLAPVTLELISPANGAVFDSQPVLLTWTTLPGGPRYNVEITRCDPQTGACSTDLVTANASEYLLTLTTSAQVTWRVQAINPDGSLTAFTPTRTFLVFLPIPSATPTPTLFSAIAITIGPSATPTPFSLFSITLAPHTATPTPLIQPATLNPGLLFTATPTPTPTHPSGLGSPEWIRPSQPYTVVSGPLLFTLDWDNLPGILVYEVGIAKCKGTAPEDVACEDYLFERDSYPPWADRPRYSLGVGLYQFVVRAYTQDTGPGPTAEPRLVDVRLPTTTPRPGAIASSTPTGSAPPAQPTPTPQSPVMPNLPTLTPRPTDTPIPPRPSDTPAATAIPIAPPDRDQRLTVRAGESTRFSDAVSFPDGDTIDTVVIVVEGLGRGGQSTMLTLNCGGVGTESLRWEVRGVLRDLTCGASVAVSFQPDASQQTVVITLPRASGRTYVTYTLSIAPA